MREHNAETREQDQEGAAVRPTERSPEVGSSLAGVHTAAGLLELQRLAGNRAVAGMVENDLSTVNSVLQSAGQPLAPDVRADMESRLGHDFSDVRVHTDNAAHDSAEAVNAHAYTAGSHVVFQRDAFNPTSQQGRTTLAHELTHVVQQRSGPVDGSDVGGGVSVSDPGDRFEREAATSADRAMASDSPVLAPAKATGAPSSTTSVQRDDKKEQKYNGPTPNSPFDHPAVQVDLAALTREKLHTLTVGQIAIAYTDYGKAIAAERLKLEAEEKARQEQSELVWNVALAVALMPVGGAIAAAAGSTIAGPAVQSSLTAAIRDRGPAILKAAGVAEAEAANWMSNDALQAVSSKTVTDLAAKFSVEKATAAVAGAQDKLKGMVAKVSAGSSPIQAAISYLNALETAASPAAKNLNDALAGASVEELIGVYNSFQMSTLDVYKAEIGAQASHFKEQVAPVLADRQAGADNTGGGTGQSFAMVNAPDGKPHLAVVRYLPSSATYTFKHWVTPDMMPIAMAMTGGKPLTVPNSEIVGDIPAPEREQAAERVVRMDAWGHERLAIVQIADEWHLLSANEKSKMTFVRWVADEDRTAAETKGATQNGGINEVKPADVTGLREPVLQSH